MASFENFYENHEEAVRRIRGTIVTYDGEPFHVIAITNHKPDGIFRVYLQPLGLDPTKPQKIPNMHHDYPATHSSLGPMLDTWMANPSNEGHQILRKTMNSPKFDKFRPFALGMCNYTYAYGKETSARCYWLERQPIRPKVEQGLIKSAVVEKVVTLGDDYQKTRRGSGLMGNPGGGGMVDIHSAAFRDCVMGNYPKAQACLDVLIDVEGYINEAVAFDRNFALVRGPLGMIFLAYKADIIGVLPKLDFSLLRLGHGFGYAKEAVEGLKLFKQVIVSR